MTPFLNFQPLTATTTQCLPLLAGFSPLKSPTVYDGALMLMLLFVCL